MAFGSGLDRHRGQLRHDRGGGAAVARLTVLDLYAEDLPVDAELLLPNLGSTHEEDFFIQYCRDRGVAAMDLRPYFLAQARKGVKLKTFGHWSPREHRTAAEALATYLLEHKLVSRLGQDATPRTNRPGTRGAPGPGGDQRPRGRDGSV